MFPRWRLSNAASVSDAAVFIDTTSGDEVTPKAGTMDLRGVRFGHRHVLRDHRAPTDGSR